LRIVDAEELPRIEQQVNDEIRLNTEIETNVTSLEEAVASGRWRFSGQVSGAQRSRGDDPDPRQPGDSIEELCGGTARAARRRHRVLKIVSENLWRGRFAASRRSPGIGALSATSNKRNPAAV